MKFELGVITGVLIGVIIGGLITNKIESALKNKVIEYNCAHISPDTGLFEWKDSK